MTVGKRLLKTETLLFNLLEGGTKSRVENSYINSVILKGPYGRTRKAEINAIAVCHQDPFRMTSRKEDIINLNEVLTGCLY